MGEALQRDHHRQEERQEELIYRPFLADDAVGCIRLFKSVFKKSTQFPGVRCDDRLFGPCPMHAIRGMRVMAANMNYRVVLRDGDVAGMAGHSRKRLGVKITDVGVSPERQGEGIGTFLIEKLLVEISRMWGIKGVWLDTERQNIGFYERLGFEVPDWYSDCMLNVEPINMQLRGGVPLITQSF